MDLIKSEATIKAEPEFVVCHNDDDVEIAYDPFETYDVPFDIKKEADEENHVDETNVDIKCLTAKSEVPEQLTIDIKPSLFPLSPASPNNVCEQRNAAIDDGDAIKLENEPSSPFNSVPSSPSIGNDQDDDFHASSSDDADFIPKIKQKKTVARAARKIHQCLVCKKTFSRLSHCKTHMAMVHGKDELLNDIVDKDPAKTCEICNKMFAHVGNYRTHMKIHSGERNFKCTMCDKDFILAQHLRSHMKIVHSNEKSHQCNICGKLFNHAGNHKKHMRTHTGERPFKCTQCDKSFGSSSNYKTHMDVHLNNRQYQCHICDRTFIQSVNLMLHLRVHTGEKPYKCTVCEKTFRLMDQCKVHMRIHTGKQYMLTFSSYGLELPSSFQLLIPFRIHTGAKPYTCSICAKSFRRLNHFRAHEKTHTDSKPFQCCECNRRFASEDVYEVHLKRHAQVYPCKVCEFVGKTTIILNRHTRQKHPAAEEIEKQKQLQLAKEEKKNAPTPTAHICSVCGKIFKERRRLTIHMKIHTGYRPHQCQYCEKRFITRNECNKHTRIHTGEKPYKCNLCEKTFRHTNSAQIHMRNHIGERPFKCTICEKRYPSASDCNKHIKTHKRV